MKRKAIEKIAPVQPQKRKNEEYVTTVQTMDNILILNVYKDGKLRGRHALNPETGEYSQYRAEEKDWKVWKYAALLGIDTTVGGWYSTSEKKRCVFDTEEQEEIVRKALEKKYCSYRTYNLIDDAEKTYQKNKRDKTEQNRLMRVQNKMNLVPKIPKDAREWIWRQEGAEDFAFFSKETGKWHCTACKKEYAEKYLKRSDGEKKIRHNDAVICPRCKSMIVAKKRTKQIVKKTHLILLQKMNDKMSVIRNFDVRMIWNQGGREIRMNEAVRTVMNHLSANSKYVLRYYYNQYTTSGAYAEANGWDYEYAHFDDKSNPAQRRTFAAYLYPEGIEEALDDTIYAEWGKIFAQIAAVGKKLDYNRLLPAWKDKRIVGIIEYLSKGRFYRLLRDTSESMYWSEYHGTLYINGESIEEIFGIHDKQIINRIREVDGGEKMVMWMRWSVAENQKISQDVMEWLSKEDIAQSDVEFIKDRMTIQQIMNYVKRQKAECYRSKTAKQILNQWSDYLEMLRTLRKKTEDEMMYRPRELKRRHDECVEEIRRRQMIAEMKRNAAQRAAEAKRMREKFPGAEDILKEIKSKYEYKGEEYIIVVPQKLIDIVTEGQALHHCAGATDRYFDRIMQNETYICFLRKASEPKIPYYTIEVEPGGTIRQHRGMYDEEPDIKKIKPFLREWQKEIRKRMSKEDHELAAVSAEKRTANIEELKAKNNTRVLNGLMEDFMEAAI